MNNEIKIGNIYKDNEIANKFNVDRTQGIRPSTKNNLIVLIDKITENIYGDTFHNNELMYVGAGRKHDQKMTGRNKTLRNALINKNKRIYLFYKEYSNHYIYAGPVKRGKEPIHKAKVNDRNVYIFPIISSDDSDRIRRTYKLAINGYVDNEDFKNYDPQNSKNKQKNITKLKKDFHKFLVNTNNGDLGNHKKKYKDKRYIRNRHIRNFAIHFAELFDDGKCQKCHKRPFTDDRTGEPYLESHHINWLSRHGKDSIKNVIALCPNCHKEMHFSKKYDLHHCNLVHKYNGDKVIKGLQQRALYFFNKAKN